MMIEIPIYLFVIFIVLSFIGLLGILIFVILLADFITMLVQDKKRYGIGGRKEDVRND